MPVTPATLSFVSRAAVGLGSAVLAGLNPARADLVAALGEVSGGSALRRLQERMVRSEQGVTIFHERRELSSKVLDPEKLAEQCRPGSFGSEYARFMLERGFSPDERPAIRFIEDPDLAYVMLRYRQVHDFWHVLLDLDTSVLGELTLKWFEWSHTGLPSCLLGASVGSLRLSSEQQLLLARDLVPWALRAGKECEDLLCISYEDVLDEELTHLREQLRILDPPLSPDSPFRLSATGDRGNASRIKNTES